MYHGISSKEHRNEVRNIFECNLKLPVFEKQMHYLAKHCNVISLSDFVQGKNLRKGIVNVVISFDDGYRNNYTKAYPILRKHSLPAVFALTTGFVMDRRPLNNDIVEWLLNRTKKDICRGKFMDQCYEFRIGSKDEKAVFYKWALNYIVDGEQKRRGEFIENIAKTLEVEVDIEEILSDPDYEPLTTLEIQEMACDSLVEFAAHSDSHCNLAKADDIQLQEEIGESKKKIEFLTARGCDTFCIPAGRYNHRCISALWHAGIQTVMTSDKFEFDHKGNDKPTVIGRNCVMTTHDNLSVFSDMVNGFVQHTYHKLSIWRQRRA
jgi:peptidoglycan/xylan/chitin deacetylase (PgdA/CDA1 family)